MVQVSEVSALLRIAGHRVRPAGSKKMRMGYIGGHSGENLGDDLLRDAAEVLLTDQMDLVDYELSWRERRLERIGLSGQRYFEGCVLGGGTLISNFWAGKVERALGQGLPMWTLGTGAGACGFIDHEDQDLMRWVPMLNAFRGLGVRGPRSVAKLEAIGVKGAHVIGDSAFALTPAKVQPACGTPILALNMSWPAEGDLDHGEQAWIDRARDCIPGLVSQGWRVRPFLMNEQDRIPTERVLKGVDPGSVEPVVRPSDVYQLIDLLSDCQMTLAVRLHAAVLSTCAGVPPLLLSYRDKCLDFMESMRLQDWAIPMQPDRIEELEPKLQQLAEVSPTMRQEIWSCAKDYQQKLSLYSKDIYSSD